MNNKPLVYTALSSLSGKFYASREELDDAVFSHFGLIQNLFPGQSHREFVDLLLRTGWVINKLDGYLVTLGSPETKPEAPAPQPPSEISYAGLQVIIEIGSSNEGMIPVSQYAMNQPVLDELIRAGLVERTNRLHTHEFITNDSAMQTAVIRAKAEIDMGNYRAASSSLSVAAEFQDKNAKAEFIYRLTQKGMDLRERLGSARIKI